MSRAVSESAHEPLEADAARLHKRTSARKKLAQDDWVVGCVCSLSREFGRSLFACAKFGWRGWAGRQVK